MNYLSGHPRLSLAQETFNNQVNKVSHCRYQLTSFLSHSGACLMGSGAKHSCSEIQNLHLSFPTISLLTKAIHCPTINSRN